MSLDYNLLTFKSINTFVNDLSEIFGSDFHSLKLYQRLLHKTGITHDVAINKHIQAFKTFCVDNREAIIHSDISKLNNTPIEYSARVFIDIKKIITAADDDTKKVIWKHLLTISAFVDPAGRAKEILKNTTSSPTNESNFLENIINKVETNVNPNASNPLEVVNSLMSSGVFNELLTGMNDGLQNGSLDLSKLVGTVEKVCSNIIPPNPDGSAPPPLNLSGMMQQFMPLIQTMSSGASSGTPNIDLNSMMQEIMSSQSQNNKTIVEEK